jgi:hypothetical protein
LDKLQFQWKHLPSSLQTSLLAGIEKNVNIYKLIKLSGVLYRLGKLGVKWHLLSPTFRDSLFKAIEKHSTFFSSASSDLNLFTYCFIHLIDYFDIKWFQFPEKVQRIFSKEVERYIPFCYPQKIRYLIYR